MHVHANIESLSWESEFFRLNSAKLYFNETAERLTEADLNAFERVQAKVPAHRLELVDALSALGFRLVEGEVKLSLNIAAEPTATQTAPLPGVRMATPKDIPQLRTSAAKVFATSRFRAPWYDSADCARFYAVWIEKAVLGRFDHQCLLALDDQGQPVGFVSLRHIAVQEARIGLLAAYSGGTGKGIGSRLMTAAITQCARRGVQRLRGPPRSVISLHYGSISGMMPLLETPRIGFIEVDMIPFNAPPVVGTEIDYMQAAISSGKLCGDGGFTHRCQQWMEQRFTSPKVLLTPSCTASLEMAAMLLDIKPGDEVIMPSFTFVSTANAFVLRGATVVFVDVRPDTMNIDESKIEAAITKHTRVIVPVHYAGVACEMDSIMALAQQYNLLVVEDAAQGMMSTYKGQALGTIGHIGCFSFHETKNYTAGGEGGAILVNDPTLVERAEVIREKGTNRSQFFRGQVDKYTWRDIGSSYLMSDLQAAYLWGQLEAADRINQRRLSLWKQYYDSLLPLVKAGRIALPSIPAACVHNAHMFYIKLRDIEDRTAFIDSLKAAGIMSVFHYIPLHTCPAGEQFGRFAGEDRYTSQESARLVRLPLFYTLSGADQYRVINSVLGFFA